MKTLLSLLLATFLLSVSVMAQSPIINTFILEDVQFTPQKEGDFLNITLKGSGKYERMDYPRLKIFVNDQLAASTGILYGMIIEDGYQLSSTLKEIPEKAEILVVITSLHHQDGAVFSYKKVTSPNQKKKD